MNTGGNASVNERASTAKNVSLARGYLTGKGTLVYTRVSARKNDPMPKNGVAAKTKTQGLYDRIADVQNLAMKVNCYRASVAKYLKSLDLKIGPDSLVLDAGSGTGIVTLAFQDAGFRPKRAIALDLSFNSLKVSSEEFKKRKRYSKRTNAVKYSQIAFS